MCVCVLRVGEGMGCCYLFQGLERQGSIVVNSESMAFRLPCLSSVATNETYGFKKVISLFYASLSPSV